MKPNLVLIHSFPTNSKLLAGMIEYLEDFFVVHFIDLPGFTREESALKDISIASYASYVQARIDKLQLKEYFIGAISFGFIVVLNLKLDFRCKGILAIEPFVGTPGLHVKKSWKFVYLPIISLVTKYNFGAKLWKNAVFRLTFKKFFLGDRPISIARTILDEIDGNAFFETFRLILSTPIHENLHDHLPHVLLVNKDDTTIRAAYIESLFRKNVPKLLVIQNDMPHFPDDLSKAFFAKTIDQDIIRTSIDFLRA